MIVLSLIAVGIVCWVFYEMAMVPKPPYIEDLYKKDEEGHFWRPSQPDEVPYGTEKKDEQDSLLDS